MPDPLPPQHFHDQRIARDQALSSLQKAMGVQEFRPGRQILRDERHWRVGEIHVEHAWHAAILPSFHDQAVLAVARTNETAFRGATFPAFFRAGIAIISLDTYEVKQAIATNITGDPMPAAVSKCDLLEPDKGGFLDGIGYEIRLDTATRRVTIEFGNPRGTCFRAIEDALFRIATDIGSRSGNSTIHKYVMEWQQYLDRKSA